MDNLKLLTKLEEAQHGFALKLETDADVFIKEDGSITTSFKPLHFPNIVLSTTPLDKFSPQELLKVNNAFLRHLIELLNNQLKENNSEFYIDDREQKAKEPTKTYFNTLLDHCSSHDDLDKLNTVLGLLKENTESPVIDSFTYDKQKVINLTNEINNTTQTKTTEKQTPTNSNSLANCTPEDFKVAKKVLKAALDSNPDLHTSNTLQNFLKNFLPELERQADKLLKEELTNQTKNRFNLLLERAQTSTDVSIIHEALILIDSLAYPNFEWKIEQVNSLYKKLNDN